MKVYRIENEKGHGPYQVSYQFWTNTKHFNSKKRPAVQDDFDNFTKEFFCGFENMKQLGEWFSNKEIEKLETLGFSIKELNVSEYFIGKSGKQIIFKKEK